MAKKLIDIFNLKDTFIIEVHDKNHKIIDEIEVPLFATNEEIEKIMKNYLTNLSNQCILYIEREVKKW